VVERPYVYFGLPLLQIMEQLAVVAVAVAVAVGVVRVLHQPQTATNLLLVVTQGRGVVGVVALDLMRGLQMVRQLLAALALLVVRHRAAPAQLVTSRGEQAALAALEGLLVLLVARVLLPLLDFQFLVIIQRPVQVVALPVLIFLVYLLQHFPQPVLGWVHLLNRS